MQKKLFHDRFIQMKSAWSIGVILGCILVTQIAFSEEPLVLQPDDDGVQRATITMESYVFAPKDLVVQVGKPVELTLENNSFLVPHNFLLDSPDPVDHQEAIEVVYLMLEGP